MTDQGRPSDRDAEHARTSPDAAPWWASDAGVPSGRPSEEDEDPLTRHRRARAGGRPGADGDVGQDAGDPDPVGSARDAGASTPGWWAPAAEAVARLSEDLAATAADNARDARGHRAWHGEGPTGAAGDPSSARGDRPAGASGGDGDDDRGRAGADAAHLEVCGVCPICVGLRALGTHRPELVGHLAEAARHLAAAVRSVVDTAAAETDHGQAGQAEGLTRIDLDDLDDLADGPRHRGGR